MTQFACRAMVRSYDIPIPARRCVTALARMISLIIVHQSNAALDLHYRIACKLWYSKKAPIEKTCQCNRMLAPTCVFVRSDTLVFGNPCIARFRNRNNGINIVISGDRFKLTQSFPASISFRTSMHSRCNPKLWS